MTISGPGPRLRVATIAVKSNSAASSLARSSVESLLTAEKCASALSVSTTTFSEAGKVARISDEFESGTTDWPAIESLSSRRLSALSADWHIEGRYIEF